MRSKEEAARVIYVRHGKTDFPLDRIYCDDKEDPPLNELGVSQVQQAVRALVKVDVAAVYASPSMRTRMTAELIADSCGLSVELESNLVERRFGFWEGMFFDEIEARFPDEYREWKINNAAFKPKGGESVFDLSDRVEPCISKLVDDFRGKVVVVVSHVGPIRTALARSIALPLEKYRSLIIDYASISIVDYGRRQNNLVCLNR